MQKVSDNEIKMIYENAEKEGKADRNETYSPEDIEIIPTTEKERRQWEEDVNNPEYDIYDMEDDDDDDEE